MEEKKKMDLVFSIKSMELEMIVSIIAIFQVHKKLLLQKENIIKEFRLIKWKKVQQRYLLFQTFMIWQEILEIFAMRVEFPLTVGKSR